MGGPLSIPAQDDCEEIVGVFGPAAITGPLIAFLNGQPEILGLKDLPQRRVQLLWIDVPSGRQVPAQAPTVYLPGATATQQASPSTATNATAWLLHIPPRSGAAESNAASAFAAAEAEAVLVETLSLGYRQNVDGFVRTTDPPELLVQAVLAVIKEQQSFCSPSLLPCLIKAIEQVSRRRHRSSGRAATEKQSFLSAREREVAYLAAQGLSNREIAERLFLSENTMKGQTVPTPPC